MIVTNGAATYEAQELIRTIAPFLGFEHKGRIRIISPDDIRVSFLDNVSQSTIFCYFYRRVRSGLFNLGWKLRVAQSFVDGTESCIVYDRRETLSFESTLDETSSHLTHMFSFISWPIGFSKDSVFDVAKRGAVK